MEESFDFMSILAIIIIILIIFIYWYQNNRDADIFKYLNRKTQLDSVVYPQQFRNPIVHVLPEQTKPIKETQKRNIGPVHNFHQSFNYFNSNRLGWRKVYDSNNNKDITNFDVLEHTNFKDIPTDNYLYNLENTKNIYL